MIGDVGHHWLNDVARLLYNHALRRTAWGKTAQLFPTLILNRNEQLFRLKRRPSSMSSRLGGVAQKKSTVTAIKRQHSET